MKQLYCIINNIMKQAEDKNKNPKIGRPIKSEKGVQFKKQYQVNQIKFQIQCQLLVTIHQTYFVQPPLDPHNRRVQVNYITCLFQKYNCMQTYEVLLAINQFYYKNSSVFPEDKLRYTSLIDIAYMFKQLRIKLGEKIRCIQLVLTVLFHLYNQKLVNLKFYQYIQTKLSQIARGLIADPAENKKLDKIELLIITLILQIASKEQIKLKK